MSTDWIEVDPAELADTMTKKVNGVRITFMPSPYDLPEAFRGFYDEEINRFVLEFQYLGDEKREREQHGEFITLRLGVNSGRLYGIEIDVNAAKAEWVQLVQKAISERTQAKPRRRDNYEAARRLVREHVPELAAAS